MLPDSEREEGGRKEGARPPLPPLRGGSRRRAPGAVARCWVSREERGADKGGKEPRRTRGREAERECEGGSSVRVGDDKKIVK